MAKVLIVYATVEGQTAKIAEALASELRHCNHRVIVFEMSKLPRGLEPKDFDGVVVGAPVHATGFPRKLKRWVKNNAPDLPTRTGLFFSVCLGILQTDDPEVQREERKIVHAFFDGSGWRPVAWSIFPGALKYTKYGWLKRLVMRENSRRAKRDADTRRDFEYTDWEQVRRVARDYDRQLREALGAGSGGFRTPA